MTIRIGIQAILIVVLLLVLQNTGMASGVEWSGRYRLEYNSLQNPTLASGGSTKEYINHHFVLKPKIVAADGLNIYGRFDILNGSLTDQVGTTLGGTLSTPAQPSFPELGSKTETISAESLMVSQLYLVLNNEYGALIAGRVPFEFGLGMSHNAGDGEFDHFFDTRDMVGYKMVFGNYYFLPSVAKLNESNLNNSVDDVTEYNFQVQLDNPETDTAMGLIYSMRRSAIGGNSSPTYISGNTYSVVDGIDYNLLNIYVEKKWSQHRLGVEVGMYDGNLGLSDASLNTLSVSGTGLALEYDWQPKARKYSAGFRAGRAQGDNTTSSDRFEGFSFDRNYDVALIMFNHSLGQADIFQNNLTNVSSAPIGAASADVEAISNAVYIAPYVNYLWSDKLSIKTSLITGTIGETLGNGDGNLGFELDVSLSYKPHESLTWVNELGYLMPGKAFEAGSNGFETKSFYALFSKIAISF